MVQHARLLLCLLLICSVQLQVYACAVPLPEPPMWVVNEPLGQPDTAWIGVELESLFPSEGASYCACGIDTTRFSSPIPHGGVISQAWVEGMSRKEPRTLGGTRYIQFQPNTRTSEGLGSNWAGFSTASAVDLGAVQVAEDEVLNLWFEVDLSRVTVPGDVDLDGIVGFSDFLILGDNFGISGGTAQGDIDQSGTIGFPDFLILASNFGNSGRNLPETTAFLDSLSEPQQTLPVAAGEAEPTGAPILEGEHPVVFIEAVTTEETVEAVVEAPVRGTIGPDGFITLHAQDQEILGVEFFSETGALRPVGDLNAEAAPFQFFLANDAQQVTLGNLNVGDPGKDNGAGPLVVDGSIVLPVRYADGVDPWTDLSAQWGDPAQVVFDFPVTRESTANAAAVPEPSTCSILWLGVVAAGWLRRRN